MKSLRTIAVCLLGVAASLSAGCSSGKSDVNPPAGPTGPTGPTGPSGPSGPTGPGLAEEVQLLRDTFGVPHIYAETDAGAFYGLGYAMAEDRLFQMHWLRLLARGRGAEFFGAGADDEYIKFDTRMRQMGLGAHADRLAAELEPDDLALLQSFARGVNQYAGTSGAVLHPFFDQFGIPVQDWTPGDSVLCHLFSVIPFAPSPFGGEVDTLLTFEQAKANFGEQAAIDYFTDPGPVDDSAAVVQFEDVSAAWLSDVEDFADSLGLSEKAALTGARFHYQSAGPKFSHAWVVDGEHSTTGGALLYGDPRTQIFVPSFFYESHIAGKTFDARGAGPVGTPHMLVGTTDRVGWSVTSLGADVGDFFELETDEATHPDQYRLDGDWLDYENVRAETIRVKGGANVVVTYRESHFGPEITASIDSPPAGRTFALRSVFIDPDVPSSLPGFLGMMRANDVEQFGAAIEGWRTPGANVLAGDRGGNIGYWCKGPIPIRTEFAPLGGRMVQDGSSADFDWLAYVPQDLMPHAINPERGWLLSANHAPVGGWYPLPLSLTTGGKGDTQRSRRLRERITAKETFAPEDVVAIHHDAVNVSRRDIAAVGIALREMGYPPGVDAAVLNKALLELKPWLDIGAPMTNEHHGAVLASFIFPLFRDLPEEGDPAGNLIPIWGAGENGLQLFLKGMLAKVEANEPFTLDEGLWILQRIEEAYAKILDEIGPDTDDWLPWFETEKLTWSFETWTTLAPVPSLMPGEELVVGPMSCTDGGTMLSLLGQAYSFSVLFGATATNHSIAPMGQSERAGPHDLDQKALLEDDTFKPAPTAKSDVLAEGTLSETILLFDPEG